MPCKHECACIEKVGRSLYHFTDNYFQAKIYRVAYVESINLITDIEMTQSTSNKIYILPPIIKTRPDKSREKRKAS